MGVAKSEGVLGCCGCSGPLYPRSNDRQQHWHRDRPLTHKTQGKVLTVFVPWNVDIPADASCGRYVPLSHEAVPKPWYEYALDMDVGDMVVFKLELIHCGGAVLVALPAGTPPVIAFIVLANYNLHYKETVPISCPPWAYAEGTEIDGEMWAQRMPQEGGTAPAFVLHVQEGPTVPNPWNWNLLRLRCNTHHSNARTL